MVTISLKQAAAGDWRVCRSQITLFSNLQLGAAIKLARVVARDEHQRLGRQVRVECPGRFPRLSWRVTPTTATRAKAIPPIRWRPEHRSARRRYRA